MGNSHGIRPFTHGNLLQPQELTVIQPGGVSEPLFETVEPFVHDGGIASVASFHPEPVTNVEPFGQNIGVDNFNSAVEPFVHGIQPNSGQHQSFHQEPVVGSVVEPFVHGLEVSSGPVDSQSLVQSPVQPFIHGDGLVDQEAVPLASEVHQVITDPKVSKQEVHIL